LIGINFVAEEKKIDVQKSEFVQSYTFPMYYISVDVVVV
jgi:hypothetical protein